MNNELGFIEINEAINSLNNNALTRFNYICHDNKMKDIQKENIVPIIAKSPLILDIKKRIINKIAESQTSQSTRIPRVKNNIISIYDFEISQNKELIIKEISTNNTKKIIPEIQPYRCNNGSTSWGTHCPTNNYVAYYSNDEIHVLDLVNDKIVIKQKMYARLPISWSPRGNYLTYRDDEGVTILNISKNNAITLKGVGITWSKNENFFVLNYFKKVHNSLLPAYVIYSFDNLGNICKRFEFKNNKKFHSFSPDNNYILSTRQPDPAQPRKIEIDIFDTQNFNVLLKRKFTSKGRHIIPKIKWHDNKLVISEKLGGLTKTIQLIDFEPITIFNNFPFSLEELILLQGIERAAQQKKSMSLLPIGKAYLTQLVA